MPIIDDKTVKALCALDPIFSDIKNLYGLPPSWERPEGFETLSHIILEQQVSLESALSAYNKLKDKLGDFTPENMLTLSDEEMRNCYLSRQKTRYLRELAKAIISKDLILSNLSKLSKEEVKTELTKVIGIGNWTAQIYLMFCLKSPDIFPPGDIAAINTVKELKGAKNKEEAVEIAKKWSPYQTGATFFLWYFYLKKRGRAINS